MKNVLSFVYSVAFILTLSSLTVYSAPTKDSVNRHVLSDIDSTDQQVGTTSITPTASPTATPIPQPSAAQPVPSATPSTAPTADPSTTPFPTPTPTGVNIPTPTFLPPEPMLTPPPDVPVYIPPGIPANSATGNNASPSTTPVPANSNMQSIQTNTQTTTTSTTNEVASAKKDKKADSHTSDRPDPSATPTPKPSTTVVAQSTSTDLPPKLPVVSSIIHTFTSSAVKNILEPSLAFFSRSLAGKLYVTNALSLQTTYSILFTAVLCFITGIVLLLPGNPLLLLFKHFKLGSFVSERVRRQEI